MASYIFKMEVVTPLFLSGADQSQAELRPPSIKGALRFWYRAMMGTDLLRLKASEEDDPESRLFGSTAHRSAVVLQTHSPTKSYEILSGLPQELGYLGYGPLTYNKDTKKFKATRPSWPPTTKFALKVDLPDDTKLISDFLSSLWLLCNLGGLGSRSRRGWGGVQIESCNPQIASLPMTITAKSHHELKQQLKEGLALIFEANPCSKRDLPSFSAFSRETKIYVYPEEFLDWQNALETIGRNMIDYRSRGPHPKGTTRGQNVGSDYLSVKAFLDSGELDNPPLRAAFGLPHNYFFSSRKEKHQSPWGASFEGEHHDRRASPLIIHVTKLSSGKFAVVLTYLKAQFLPPPEKIRALARGGNAHDKKVDQPSDKAIIDFLGRLNLDEGEVKIP